MSQHRARHTATRSASSEQTLFDWAADTPDDPRSNPVVETPGDAGQDKSANSSCRRPSAESSVDPISQSGFGYDPSHPWRYYAEGDDAPPIPFDDILPAEDYGCSLKRELPKPVAKRIIKMRELLETERIDLERARARYEDVIARGADALSQYDREIAYGGNLEMARAGTLALLYRQISWRRGRISFLEREDSRQGALWR